MELLDKIKSEKIKSILSESKKFNGLSISDRESFVNIIASFSLNKQESIFLPFLESEKLDEIQKIQEYKNEKSEKLKNLIGKIEEIKSILKKLDIKDRELLEQTKEGRKQTELLEQLSNL